MATPIEYVEEQWQAWQEKNPANKFEHIDEEQMKKVLIEDLTYASQMDVREYTLYQKWCEVKERYPVHEVSTLWGQEILMVDPKQRDMINEVKSNFWMPKDPDDYEKLEPSMVLSNGPEAERWNAIRTFSSTMKNNSNIGRNLYYIVTDEVSK